MYLESKLKGFLFNRNNELIILLENFNAPIYYDCIMSQVLYRKYRSQTFDELIGQAHITDILKKAVMNGSISHAYLFVGSRGTGKTSTARILAKAINCKNLSKEGNPCNECDSCKAITEGTFLDLIEIDAASNRGIDQIRELKERIEFSPVEGKYKIYIIDEVHMLTTEAFNALLKTLEEPPAHVVFMLATTDAHKLPATILSRCQRYDFHLGSEDQVAHVIKVSAENEGVKLTEPALKLLAQYANGSYRDALSLLDVVVSGQLESDKPNEVSENEVRTSLGIPDSTMVYYLLEKIVYKEGKEALDLVKELDNKGVNLQQFIRLVLETLRIILAEKIQGKEESEYSFSRELKQNEIIKLITSFIDAERLLRTASIPALVLEMIIAQSLIDVTENSQILKNNSGSKGSSGGSTNNKSPKPTNDNNSPKPKDDIDVKAGSKKFEGKIKSKVGSSKSTDVTTVKGNLLKSTDVTDVKILENKKIEEVIEDSAEKKPIKVVENLKEDNKLVEKKMSQKKEIIEKEAVYESSEKMKQEENPETLTSEIKEFDVKEVENNWDEIVKGIQTFNGHLYAFLKAAKVCQFENGYLVLEVPFNFHKERIESPRSREAINAVFKEVLGTTLPIRCDVNETIQRKKPSTADIVLKNVPAPTEMKVTKEAESKAELKASTEKVLKPRKVSKKVEAIFADL